MINTLLYTKKLEAVGVAREVAETHVEILSEIIWSNLTTKQDLKELELATKMDFKELELATKRDLKELEYKLTIRMCAIMGSMTAFSISTTVALIKLL